MREFCSRQQLFVFSVLHHVPFYTVIYRNVYDRLAIPVADREIWIFSSWRFE